MGLKTNLEPIIQNEISQKEKDKYHILKHICGIQKDGTDEPFAGQQGDEDIENRLMTMGGGEEGEGEMNGESSKEAYTLPYVKQIANGNLLYESGNSNQGSITIQMGEKGQEVGGRFKREGTYVYLWLIHVDVWQKSNQYIKQLSFN